jgi:hypothetical protein
MIGLDVAGLLVGFFLTIMILSYFLLDDNLLFRLGAHLLVGVSAGYLLAIMFKRVLFDQYLAELPRLSLGQIPALILLVALSILLILRVLPRGSMLAQLPMAFLVGVGAAIVVGGALTGTLLPQAVAAAEPSLLPFDTGFGFDQILTMVENWMVLFGTVASLAYFHFGAQAQGGNRAIQSGLIRPIALVGKGVIMITLGALYAGALLSTLAVMSERVYALVQAIFLVSGGGL